MNKFFIAFIVRSHAFLSGCSDGITWSDDQYHVRVNDNLEYVLSKSIIDKTGSIGGGIGRVSPNVIAVGSNNLYVVAKQKHSKTNVISYFYIEKSKDAGPLSNDEITQGPFNKAEFIKLKKELNLPDFSRYFGNNLQ